MNKKFSTLLCASLMLSSAFSVNAADITGAVFGDGAAKLLKLDKNALKGVYQLRLGTDGGDGVLAIKDGKYVIEPTGSLANLANSLWCIQITEQGQGKEPIYDFVNKGTGEFLAISEADVANLGNDAVTTLTDGLSVGETYGGWAFSSVYATDLEYEKPMFTYLAAGNDYVLVLMKDANGKVQVKKVKATDARTDEANRLKFTVFDAGTYVLSAAEINAYLKDNKDVLTFAPDAKADVNPFSQKAFVAKELEGGAATDHNFVYVTSKSNKNSYLKVDTAANGVGISFLKFGWTDMTKEADFANSMLVDQHKFIFSYKPSVDSLYIQVKQARYKNEKTPETYWKDVTDIRSYGDNYANVNLSDADMDAVNADCVPSKLFVKLQDFTTSQSVATIGERPINTKIGFGLKGCTPTNDKTSIANGLYIIKNAKGQVLAAPIHENANVGANVVEWVTLDEQDPLHMPAYQWVITKTLSSAVSQSTSPIKVVNREFPAAQNWANLQLKLNDKGEIVTGDNLLGNATFVQITDSAIIKDKKLGYKYIPSQDLQITKYQFNYLNPFTQDYWIANGAGKDSLVYVKQDANEYSLVEGSTAEYGIEVDAAVLAKIPGLAQLERTNYVIAKDKANRLVKAYGSKFSMGAANYNTVAEVDTFFFKENNHFDGKHFYAILESDYQANKAIIAATNTATKVGIADDGMTAGLKVQLLNESRTSAFTVEPSTTPLYRRFNSELLEGNAGDATDSLRFVEMYRGENLQIEANPNFMKEGIDFLGIYTADKATSGLAFIVDTAWVNRGLGYIKPQYLISIDRHDFEGVAGEPCQEAGPHVDKDGNITDADHCVHAKPAIPSFERGKYLINFHNFAAENEDLLWKKYDRAGFVEAIRVQDTLYILRDEFKDLANDKINFASIKAAEEVAKKANGYVNHIYNLAGDNHKYVTWSMRFKNKEVASNEKEEDRAFLIESMKDCVRPGALYTAGAGEGDIAPLQASWLKMQNGCLVLSTGDSKFDEFATGNDDALIFNVKHVANDEIATDTEDITTNTVSVIAGNGTVTIKGAAGKKVTIANVLGQTIANTVLSSDDATIAAPAGVAVVAVEGEAAVKAIVK